MEEGGGVDCWEVQTEDGRNKGEFTPRIEEGGRRLESPNGGWNKHEIVHTQDRRGRSGSQVGRGLGSQN